MIKYHMGRVIYIFHGRIYLTWMPEAVILTKKEKETNLRTGMLREITITLFVHFLLLHKSAQFLSEIVSLVQPT